VANSAGGGIVSSHHSLATLTVVNSTLAANSASSGGGIYDLFGSRDRIQNTVVARNTTTVAAPDMASGATSDGNNLIGDGDSAAGFVNGTNGDKVGTTANPIDAKLETDANGKVVVKDNGGPTQTIALLAGSPAVDAGSDAVLGSPYNLTTDQRGPGFARKQGAHVDIGAFEKAPK
jgi:hypothetical protein